MSSDGLGALKRRYEASEREKYRNIWLKQDYSGKTDKNWIIRLLKSPCLEIGCGTGLFTDLLGKFGIEATGVDITLEGLRASRSLFYRAPAWDMPFMDGEFETSFSFDTLEHIPTELVPAAIAEIDRVTRGVTIHSIATWPDRQYYGYTVHMTVKPIQWWEEQFKSCKCKVILKERMK